MKTTDLFIIINDETLETVKRLGGKTAKFETEADAYSVTSVTLESWSVVRIAFSHRFIGHTVN